MGMGMILATAEMLKHNYVMQTIETTGTNYNEAKSALKGVIPHLSKIAEQRKKMLKVLNMDESKSWGYRILVWCNIVRTNPPVQLGINGRCLPFIVNKKKEDDFDSSMFNASQCFTAKSST
eukprot:12983030-Ditylum_brightwellii.AAC.1